MMENILKLLDHKRPDINQVISEKGELVSLIEIMESAGAAPPRKFNLVSLVFIGLQISKADRIGGTYFCDACSRDHKKAIYHQQRQNFASFREIPVIKNNLKTLQFICDNIL